MKEKILENLTKRKGIKPTFLKENNMTHKECYDIINSDINKKCCICGNETIFLSFTKGYKETCDDVNCKNANTKQKSDNTLLERYGTTDRFSINNGRERGLQKCNNDEDISRKRKETCKQKYGGDTPFHSMEFQESLKDIIEEKYGVRNISYLQETKDKISEKNLVICTSDEMKNRRNKLDNNGETSIDKQKKTNIMNGKWVADEYKSDYELYHRNVWKITKKQDLKSLQNIEKRGHITFDENAYHLDHKFSIIEGFVQNIPIEIIGDIINLEMIHNKENARKREKCSISKEELLGAYYDKK